MAKDDAEQTLTPKLRFPEFREEWRESPLGTVVKEFRANSTIQDQHEVLTSARRGLIRQVDYYGEGRITERDNVGFNVIPADYLTYRSRTDDGRFYFNHNDLGITGIISVYYPVFHSINGSNAFLASLLNRFSAVIGTHSVGTSQRVLPISKLMRIRLPFPVAQEQQKIANCLTSLDACVAAQGRKVEALKAHKKGLMQQLFPREGETLPRLRFPEFRDEPEWDETPLDACFLHIRNGFVGTATPFYANAGVPYLQGKNVKKGRIDPTGLVTISRVFHDKQKKSQLQRGDIVMVQSGHVGECAFIDDAYAGANCHALIIMTPKNRQHSPFFVHCFGSDYGTRLIAQITTGNTIEHILASDMKALVVRTPQFAEQQRIAACLASLDAQIAAESEKLDALKTHKKGLLQQLFPSPEGD